MQTNNKDAATIVPVSMKEIFADPTFNCRGSVAPIDVTELARDIDEHGLQQPIVIKPMTDSEKYKYKIVSGHRRFVAFKVLNREVIPSIINPNLTDAQALILNLGENLHRQDLNIRQEANALHKLKLEGFSAHDVAVALGKSATWVSIRYMLLELPEVIREAAAAGFITHKHIRELHKLKDFKQQIEAAKKIKEARIRGDRTPVLKKSKRNIFKNKIREKDDVFWMQNHIQEAIGNNFGTRCLAWAAGEINDFELFQDIEAIAIKTGIPYSIPYELGGVKM